MKYNDADYHRDYSNKRRLRLIAAKCCVRCAREPATPGNVHCDGCRQKNRERAHANTARKAGTGLCVWCDQPTRPGRVMCQPCADKNNAARVARKAKGLCFRCPAPALPGMVCCQHHRELSRDANMRRHRRLRHQVIMAYGGYRCACCGETTPEFLQIDHINGDGRKHRASLGSSSASVYLWLQKNGYPPGFQILCANCNHAKGIWGQCPHQRDKNPAPKPSPLP